MSDRFLECTQVKYQSSTIKRPIGIKGNKKHHCKGIMHARPGSICKKIMNRTKFLLRDPKYHSHDIYTVVQPWHENLSPLCVVTDKGHQNRFCYFSLLAYYRSWIPKTKCETRSQIDQRLLSKTSSSFPNTFYNLQKWKWSVFHDQFFDPYNKLYR